MPVWSDVEGWAAAAGGILVGVGIVSLVATVLLLPTFIARLPADHFAGTTSTPPVRTLPHRVARLAKNGLGAGLFVVGVAMLVLPGQGLLTMVIGLALLDFPGKEKLERRLAQRPAIWRFLNAVRRRKGLTPFEAATDL